MRWNCTIYHQVNKQNSIKLTFVPLSLATYLIVIISMFGQACENQQVLPGYQENKKPLQSNSEHLKWQLHAAPITPNNWDRKEQPWWTNIKMQDESSDQTLPLFNTMHSRGNCQVSPITSTTCLGLHDKCYASFFVKTSFLFSVFLPCAEGNEHIWTEDTFCVDCRTRQSQYWIWGVPSWTLREIRNKTLLTDHGHLHAMLEHKELLTHSCCWSHAMDNRIQSSMCTVPPSYSLTAEEKRLLLSMLKTLCVCVRACGYASVHECL